EIIDALERFAPLPLQDDYDNSGLQVGTTETEVSGVLLCLDVTRQVVDEAIKNGCNLIISHHPLLFRPLKKLTDDNIGSIVMDAVRAGITIYASHTNLDNASKGVNMRIARVLGLTDVKPLDEHPDGNGAGIVGRFPSAMTEDELLTLIKDKFGVQCIRHNGKLGRKISRMAVCGGSGAFLAEKAVAAGADAFMTGEIGYHRFFGYDGIIKLIETGHFESEQFTVDLIADILKESFPELRVLKTSSKTNPINYYI
ncbi:MAG: Nif3-like dinuclear metal center hexameric protein, partial [Bacteroidaceae bacterium]|nr:Nif3-like dinuclear metal center hexameric protein [Bacteroidaceae bacterium]